MPVRRLPPLLAALAGVLACAGCGLQTGSGSGPTRMLVTHAFGTQVVGTVAQKPSSGETVKGLLTAHYSVRTGPDGRVVEAIAGAAANGRGLRWAVWVNGIEPTKRVAQTSLHAGDEVWWDLHDGSAASSIPAVVGSYPEPFTSGSGGRRLPTTLECAADAQRACATVGRALRRVGVKVADQFLGGGSGSDSLAVLVGTFADIHGTIAAELVRGGPSQSGVYAQSAGSGGDALELDNPQGQVVRTLRGSAGLVAATDQPSLNEPAWLVTGTDPAGVAAAAAAIAPGALERHLAIAVQGAQVIPLPLDPAR